MALLNYVFCHCAASRSFGCIHSRSLQRDIVQEQRAAQERVRRKSIEVQDEALRQAARVQWEVEAVAEAAAKRQLESQGQRGRDESATGTGAGANATVAAEAKEATPREAEATAAAQATARLSGR